MKHVLMINLMLIAIILKSFSYSNNTVSFEGQIQISFKTNFPRDNADSNPYIERT